MNQTTRLTIFERDDFTCVYCGRQPKTLRVTRWGRPTATLHVDHVFPLALGGTNDMANLVTACAYCNTSKNARLFGDEEIPIATCSECGERGNPRGRAWLEPTGPTWICDPCWLSILRQQSLVEQREEESGAWADLNLEQYEWDCVEFAAFPEILDAKYPELRAAA